MITNIKTNKSKVRSEHQIRGATANAHSAVDKFHRLRKRFNRGKSGMNGDNKPIDSRVRHRLEEARLTALGRCTFVRDLLHEFTSDDKAYTFWDWHVAKLSTVKCYDNRFWGA